MRPASHTWSYSRIRRRRPLCFTRVRPRSLDAELGHLIALLAGGDLLERRRDRVSGVQIYDRQGALLDLAGTLGRNDNEGVLVGDPLQQRLEWRFDHFTLTSVGNSAQGQHPILSTTLALSRRDCRRVVGQRFCPPS